MEKEEKKREKEREKEGERHTHFYANKVEHKTKIEYERQEVGVV